MTLLTVENNGGSQNVFQALRGSRFRQGAGGPPLLPSALGDL